MVCSFMHIRKSHDGSRPIPLANRDVHCAQRKNESGPGYIHSSVRRLAELDESRSASRDYLLAFRCVREGIP
jgi:hypothetical protein